MVFRPNLRAFLLVNETLVSSKKCLLPQINSHCVFLRFEPSPFAVSPPAAKKSPRLRLSHGRYQVRSRLAPQVDFVRRSNSDYALSVLRPRSRRAFRTLRPAFVAILARKPWRRLRTRLDGWKVRFIAQILRFLRSRIFKMYDVKSNQCGYNTKRLLCQTCPGHFLKRVLNRSWARYSGYLVLICVGLKAL